MLSMNIRCWAELAKYGVTDVLQREYGSRVMAQPEADYHVSLEYAIDSIPPPGGLSILLFITSLLLILALRGERCAHKGCIATQAKRNRRAI